MPDKVSEALRIAAADAEAAAQSAVNQATGIRKVGEQFLAFSRALAAAPIEVMGGVLGLGVATSAALLAAPYIAGFSLMAIPFIGVSGGALGAIGFRLRKAPVDRVEERRRELNLVDDAYTRGFLTKESAQAKASQIFELPALERFKELTDGKQPPVLEVALPRKEEKADGLQTPGVGSSTS